MRAVRDGWGERTRTERQERETERLRCLILLIAPGDFLLLQTVQYVDGKQRWERFSPPRPSIFTDAAKDPGSKVTCRIEERDCGQVCASGIGPKKIYDGGLHFFSVNSKSFSASRVQCHLHGSNLLFLGANMKLRLRIKGGRCDGGTLIIKYCLWLLFIY